MRISTIFLTALVIGVGIAVLSVMSKFATEPPVAEKIEPEITVAVQSAAISTHRPVVSVIGTIEAKDEAMMTSPLDTEVNAVLVEEGDAIDKDATLVDLDVRETRFQIEAQLAQLDDIEAQLESLVNDSISERRRLTEIRDLQSIAREELERNKSLFERGLVAEAAVDQAKAATSSRELEIINQRQRLDALSLSQKRLEASRRGTSAQIGQLRVVLERAQIRSPFDGVIKTVYTSAGTRIGRGSQLVELYDPSTIRMRAAIPNEFAVSSVADKLEGLIQTTDGRKSATLLSIAPEAKLGRGTVDALFVLPAGEWLLGTAVEFDLLLPEVSQTVAVPFDALYSGNRVYRVDIDSRAEAVDCANAGLVHIDGSTRMLLNCPSLNNGDQIVINRIPNLVSGTKLRVTAS